jgi:hypothetical protein
MMRREDRHESREDSRKAYANTPPKAQTRDVANRVTVTEDMEFRALEREHAGVVHQLRLEHLSRRLDRGPIAVQHTRCGFCGQRVTLELDSGQQLVLKLLWPQGITAAALCSIRWEDNLGWLVVVRATSGDRVLLKAWRAEVHPPVAA